jgi:hypothetical protein
MERSIPLSQKLYLLGIHPEKGGIISSAYTAMDYIILGSLFLELYQAKNIGFENKRIFVLTVKTKNRLHQFLLEKLNKSQKPLKISRWINKLHFSMKSIRQEVQQGLIDERIIKMEQKRFLFFKWKKPAIINKQIVFQLTGELKSQISKGTTVEDELLLLSFIKPGGLLKRLFPEKQKRKQAQQRLKQMMVENQLSAAVADAISAANAVTASIAVSAAVSSSAS